MPGTYEVLIDGEPIERHVQLSPEAPQLWVLPATIDLAGAEIGLVDAPGRESRLLRALDQLLARHRVDYVFIDCPPSLGLLTLNALVAAEELLVPIQCEYYALEGVSQLLRTINLVKGSMNERLKLSTIVLTMYDAAAIISRIKIMSRLNIAEKRLPQDGRIKMRVQGREIDVRVSIIPMIHGEGIVMRLLDKGRMVFNLANVGMLPDTYQHLQASSSTGRTASSSSPARPAPARRTTLYSRPERDQGRDDSRSSRSRTRSSTSRTGINQIQVHAKIGLTFATALRSASCVTTRT